MLKLCAKIRISTQKMKSFVAFQRVGAIGAGNMRVRRELHLAIQVNIFPLLAAATGGRLRRQAGEAVGGAPQRGNC